MCTLQSEPESPSKLTELLRLCWNVKFPICRCLLTDALEGLYWWKIFSVNFRKFSGNFRKEWNEYRKYTSLFIRTSDRMKKMKIHKQYWKHTKAKQKEHIHTYTHRLKSITDKPATAGCIFNIKTLYALRAKFTWQTKTKKKLHVSYEVYIVYCLYCLYCPGNVLEEISGLTTLHTASIHN